MAPMLVTVLAMGLLLPSWLEKVERLGLKAWRQFVPAAALTVSLLLLLFLIAAVTGGALASPRGDLIGEIRDLLSGVLLVDLLRAWLRAGLLSNVLVEGLMVVLALKLLWVTALDPLRISPSAQ